MKGFEQEDAEKTENVIECHKNHKKTGEEELTLLRIPNNFGVSKCFSWLSST